MRCNLSSFFYIYHKAFIICAYYCHCSLFLISKLGARFVCKTYYRHNTWYMHLHISKVSPTAPLCPTFFDKFTEAFLLGVVPGCAQPLLPGSHLPLTSSALPHQFITCIFTRFEAVEIFPWVVNCHEVSRLELLLGRFRVCRWEVLAGRDNRSAGHHAGGLSSDLRFISISSVSSPITKHVGL